MAGIDKIYMKPSDARVFITYLKSVDPVFMKETDSDFHLTDWVIDLYYDPAGESAMPVTNFPEVVDRWLIRRKDLPGFVRDYITKKQYDGKWAEKTLAMTDKELLDGACRMKKGLRLIWKTGRRRRKGFLPGMYGIDVFREPSDMRPACRMCESVPGHVEYDYTESWEYAEKYGRWIDGINGRGALTDMTTSSIWFGEKSMKAFLRHMDRLEFPERSLVKASLRWKGYILDEYVFATE